MRLEIARTTADGLAFPGRFYPTRIALDDVQLRLARDKTSLTDVDAWLCQPSATLTGAPTLWTL
ncbi:hypothetical protein L1027_24315 [Escherichia coli]|nr:hypothetical protein [Escherichia coli]MCF3290863.1 hypothetical protein [Escherichia coli]